MLPAPETNQRVIAQIGGRLLVRESEYMGQSLDDLSLYLDYQPKDIRYKVSNLNQEQLRSLEALVTQEQLESFQYSIPVLKKPKQHPFNVLPKAKSDGTISGYWKACAAVFLGILVLQFSYDAVRWYQYKKWQIRRLHRLLISLNTGLGKIIRLLSRISKVSLKRSCVKVRLQTRMHCSLLVG